MNIEIRNPAALQHEIKKLIHVHYGVEEHMSFMNRYPEVYHIYQMVQRACELGRESKGRRLTRGG